ncbi:MAG: hypothetical protein Q4B70_02315 [Lachnospiraceae bacterium]|nr:hypothetical protein [Lachnospiraceae bacterium]
MIFIVAVVLIQGIRKRLSVRYLKKIEIDYENYMFYAKYTSSANRFAYIFTYLLQDFIYEVKKTNKSYNISKGLFRFDDSLGEYYIDCRMAWYAYIKTNLLKNRLSMHKLRVYSLNKCNQLLLSRFPEQEETFKSVREQWTEIVNQLPVKKKLPKGSLKKLEGARTINKLFLTNLYEMEKSRKFMMDNKARYQEMIDKAERRREDLRGIKNYYVDLDGREKEN